MSDPHLPTTDADALLAQADALHDDDPPRALEMLRIVDIAALAPARLGRLSFLLDHVIGEKFGLWEEATARLRAIVACAGADVTPLILRHAAIAAQLAGDAALTRDWTQALAASADAPLNKARALVALGAVQFCTNRLSAGAAGRQALQAMAPVLELLDAPGNGLDTAFGAVANNLASDLLERPLDDLAQADLREALARAAALAQRCWDGAGTWLNRERARYLSAMAANALGRGDAGAAHARAGLALLDESMSTTASASTAPSWSSSSRRACGWPASPAAPTPWRARRASASRGWTVGCRIGTRATRRWRRITGVDVLARSPPRAACPPDNNHAVILREVAG